MDNRHATDARTRVVVMRLVGWLIKGAGLSLFAFSLLVHYRIDAHLLDFWESRAPTPTASGGTIRVEKFGSEQTFIVRVFETRDEAERTCGRDNIMQWEVITRTESKGGRFSCRSDLR